MMIDARIKRIANMNGSSLSLDDASYVRDLFGAAKIDHAWMMWREGAYAFTIEDDLKLKPLECVAARKAGRWFSMVKS